MKNKTHEYFESGDTVKHGEDVGNIVYFKSPKIAVVCFSCNRKASVNISKLKKIGSMGRKSMKIRNRWRLL